MAIPAEFEFRAEFRRNGNHNLAGTTAKILFPRNSQNHPDSRGFHPEYVGDCKELRDWVKVMEKFRDLVLQDAPQPRTLSGQHSNIQLALLRSLVQTVSTQKKAKMLTNLLAAAMHLAFLKSAVQNKLALELPDDPLALLGFAGSFLLALN